jgi:hypothetical protein
MTPEPITDPRIRTSELRRFTKTKRLETAVIVGALALAGTFAGFIIRESRSETAALARRFELAEGKHDVAHQEFRLDVRGLYDHMLTGRRQERLEKPIETLDGGVP